MTTNDVVLCPNDTVNHTTQEALRAAAATRRAAHQDAETTRQRAKEDVEAMMKDAQETAAAEAKEKAELEKGALRKMAEEEFATLKKQVPVQCCLRTSIFADPNPRCLLDSDPLHRRNWRQKPCGRRQRMSWWH